MRSVNTPNGSVLTVRLAGIAQLPYLESVSRALVETAIQITGSSPYSCMSFLTLFPELYQNYSQILFH